MDLYSSYIHSVNHEHEVQCYPYRGIVRLYVVNSKHYYQPSLIEPPATRGRCAALELL